MESPNNSTIILKIKQSNRKHVLLVATYRGWKHPGEEDSSTKKGINKPINRIHEIRETINNLTNLKIPLLWSGDINIDMHKKNDNHHRADLKAIKPIFVDCLTKNNLALVNKEPTWFRVGKRESLLDLFIVSHPHHVLNCNNVTNMLSEHAGVKLDLNISLELQKQQFITVLAIQHL